ncbi:MAG: TusE/DsrC/DsvC family sulfur relay protein [Desulfurococcaceae archaeon]
MPVKCPGEYTVDGKKVVIDEDCYKQNTEDWDEKVAEWMARELEGIQQMTEEHWKLVRYLREYWETYGSCPPIKMVVKETGFSLEKIYQLFPSGPAHGACKVAGAPKPTGCV